MARLPRKNRNVRVEDDLWDPAMKIAEIRNEVLAEVIRADLGEYVSRNRHLLDSVEPE